MGMNKKIWKRTMQILGLLIIIGLGTFSYKGNKSNEMEFKSTLRGNELGICGEKPNCVSSFQASSDEHYIPPLSIALNDLTKIESFFKDCNIKISTATYKHIECASSMFKFIDDIEILYIDSTLHYKSSSRVGHSDLGVNRKRINSLIDYLNK
jgi:uncharacterized protein (DUF1499 family)